MNEVETQKQRWIKALQTLGHEADSFCAVGGGAVWFYLPSDMDSNLIRPTKDLDFVVPIKTKAEFYDLDARLKKLGFKNEMSPGAPLCRYQLGELIIDFIPMSEKVLNLSNTWFQPGMKNKIFIEISNKYQISVFPLPYFLAAKFEAFADRGKSDPRFSKDLEDITLILSSRSEIDLKSLFKESSKVTDYLKAKLQELAKNFSYKEAVYGHIWNSERADKLFHFIAEIDGTKKA